MSDGVDVAGRYSRTVVVTAAEGLHARPAAELVKLASTLPARTTVNGADARSILSVLALGITQGASLDIAGDDDEGGRAAVDALAELVASDFTRSGA
ncbi:MAG: HPr family phosphocarrier protein [Microbacteriaceae bacterium]|nr:HPr family phosphocarrier protein [Microbacteriaceae bacterium]MCL2794920.1 HPr family phosphocarrier protein [Microbacteriaceae bacterium]